MSRRISSDTHPPHAEDPLNACRTVGLGLLAASALGIGALSFLLTLRQPPPRGCEAIVREAGDDARTVDGARVDWRLSPHLPGREDAPLSFRDRSTVDTP